MSKKLIKTKKPVAVAAVVNSASLSRRDRKRLKYVHGELLPLVPKEVFQVAFSKALATRRAKLKRLLSADELRALSASIRRGYNPKKLRDVPLKAGVGYIPTLKSSKVRVSASRKTDAKAPAKGQRSKKAWASKPIDFVRGGTLLPSALKSTQVPVTTCKINSEREKTPVVDTPSPDTAVEAKLQPGDLTEDGRRVYASDIPPNFTYTPTPFVSLATKAAEEWELNTTSEAIRKLRVTIVRLGSQIRDSPEKSSYLASDLLCAVEELSSTYNVDTEKFFKKTCFGKTKCFLDLSSVFPENIECNVYVSKDDLERDHFQEVKRNDIKRLLDLASSWPKGEPKIDEIPADLKYLRLTDLPEGSETLFQVQLGVGSRKWFDPKSCPKWLLR